MASRTPEYTVGAIHVLHTPSSGLDDPRSNYDGIDSCTINLPVGHKKEPDCRPFQVETVFEKDIEIPMRDGTVLRGDVFRPASKSNLPAIMMFSPYGKSGTGFFDLNIQGRVGIPRSALSGYQSFEGFDPAEWVNHEYAIVNVNTRGAMGSQGTIRYWGTSEGRDGYDTVEHIAQLPWCSGRVALAGNSWLAITQWFVAAASPPHLTCILPLEGMSDLYREMLCRGGAPDIPFLGLLGKALFSDNEQEDIIAMVKKYPLFNEYWEDKRAKPHLIECPAYVLASMSTSLHAVGSIRCFEEIPHNKKWLRFHPTQEWHDLYQLDAIADFKKFLDFYTKGVKNDWEQTPQARISVLRYNQPPIHNMPFSTWPPPKTTASRFYLSNNSSLEREKSSVIAGEQTYQSDIVPKRLDADAGELSFSYTVPERTTLIGFSKAVLYMSCPDHNDMDVFVMVRKADAHGNVLRHVNIPIADLNAVDKSIVEAKDVEMVNTHQSVGSMGVLRASHWKLDESLSTERWPVHAHTSEEKISPGTVVKLEIGIWPASIRFEAGEKLVFKASGHNMRLLDYAQLRDAFTTGNKGRHVVLIGGEHASYVEVPVVEL
ncbi:Alpha/Beta hydrolase protein [Massariosphaeria phaeospora]|uniref:Alpha/Beta hydrolase protein n=1 Tax=Massariosphaeria phaeospora TaxID=100035 RepID=A0A7C8IDC8_9PLEO|nr:Alpha/Beta hydrolase protein [Massariosphaeria phaeospora]